MPNHALTIPITIEILCKLLPTYMLQLVNFDVPLYITKFPMLKYNINITLLTFYLLLGQLRCIRRLKW